MDRASASEAGNVGSTPAGRMDFLRPERANCFARVGRRRPERCFCLSGICAAKGKNREARPEGKSRQGFYRRGLPPGAWIFCARSGQTALPASGGEGRSDVLFERHMCRERQKPRGSAHRKIPSGIPGEWILLKSPFGDFLCIVCNVLKYGSSYFFTCYSL